MWMARVLHMPSMIRTIGLKLSNSTLLLKDNKLLFYFKLKSKSSCPVVSTKLNEPNRKIKIKNKK